MENHIFTLSATIPLLPLYDCSVMATILYYDWINIEYPFAEAFISYDCIEHVYTWRWRSCFLFILCLLSVFSPLPTFNFGSTYAFCCFWSSFNRKLGYWMFKCAKYHTFIQRWQRLAYMLNMLSISLKRCGRKKKSDKRKVDALNDEKRRLTVSLSYEQPRR